MPARPPAGSRRNPRYGDVPVLKIARQPYYRWLANPVTDAEMAEAYRAHALFDAHKDDPEFVYRFLVDEASDAGDRCPAGPRGGSAPTKSGGPRSARSSAARARRQGRRSTTT